MFGLFAKKGPFDAKISPSDDAVTVAAGDNLLKAALDAGLAWPHNCRVGSCGECRSRLISGKIKELNDFSYVLSQEEIDSGMILACQTCLRSDVEVEIGLEGGVKLSPPKTLKGKVAQYRNLTHDIVEIGIDLDDAIPNYLAGQYAELCVPGLIDQPRSYSFASAPTDGDIKHINFFVRLVPGGQMTTWLHEQDRTGSPVDVCGPYGNFWLRDSSEPAVFVCGGSGMAPIKALMEQVSAQGFNRDVALVFGARTQADLYCIEELEAFAQSANNRFTFTPVLSEEPEDSGWQGKRGMCTEYIANTFPNIEKCEAYLCGPPPMVDAAIAVLCENGMPEDRIYFDKFLDASHMPEGRVAASA